MAHESSIRPVCVLLSDFPWSDPYVGVMKGVLLSRVPDLTIVDLAHGLPAGDVAWAARQLRAQAGYFPAGALFLAVVDPGVGSGRRVLAARAGAYRFVGPDNGLLVPALEACAGGGKAEIVAVDTDGVRLPSGCETFHGRDVMAPAAARLLRGAPLTALGRPAAGPVPLELAQPRRDGDRFFGEVVAADGYGNLITNLPGGALREGGWHVWLGKRDLGPVRIAFADVAAGEVTAVVGSMETVEIAVRDGDAAARLGAGRGDPVEARRDR